MREFLRKEKKSLLISIVISLLFVVVTQTIRIDFQIENSKEVEGTGQLFYQTGSQAEISEENQVSTGFSEQGLEFEVKRKLFLGNEMRLDTDTDNRITITGMEVKYNGIVIEEQTSEELQAKIVASSSVEIERAEDGLSVVKTGEDPNISFSFGFSRAKMMTLWILKFLLSFCIAEGILLSMMHFYQKDKERFWKYVQIGIFVLVAASLLFSEYKLIRNICRTGEQSYYVHERNVAQVELSTAEITTGFSSVGKYMNSIEAEVYAGEGTEGTVEYSIADEEENILIQDKVPLDSILTEDKTHIRLDVSELNLVQGERYLLTMNFVECKEFAINQCENGLVLKQNFQFAYKVPFILGVIAISVLIIVLFFLIYRYGLKKKLYAATFLVVGMITLLVIPPASRDDEFRHFLRVYTLAEGEWKIEPSIAQGNEIGNMGAGAGGVDYVVSVPEEISQIRLLDYSFNYNDMTYYAEVNNTLCIDKLISLLKADEMEGEERLSIVSTGTRGMVYYWPQVIFVWIGLKLGVRPIILYYLARMGQMLACAAIGLICLKLASEKGKDMIWLLSFVPNVLLLQCSCNCDGLLIAEVMLLVSIMLWLRRTETSIFSRKGLLAAAAWAVVSFQIVKMKVPYVFLCIAALLLLRKENFGGVWNAIKKYKKQFIIGIFALVVLLGIYLIVVNHGALLVQMLYKFVSKEHVDYIVANPKTIMKLFGAKWIQQVIELYQSLNGFNIVPYAVVIVISLLACKSELKVWQRICYLLLCAGMILVMVLVGFTMLPADAGYIWGITYRYLLPILPFALLILPIGNGKTQELARRIYPVFIMLVLVTSCTSWLVWWDKM